MDLSIAIKHIVSSFNVKVDDIIITPHEAGVWGNSLYKVSLPLESLLYKYFHSFSSVDIAYDPPNVAANERLRVSVIMQKIALDSICCNNIIIPKIKFMFEQSFVMEYLEGGINLKYLLDTGEHVSNINFLGKAIAQFHNSQLAACNTSRFTVEKDKTGLTPYKLGV